MGRFSFAFDLSALVGFELSDQEMHSFRIELI